jgi:hypothetical protein
MARKRQSFESQVIEYFDKTPLATANVVFDIVKGRLKARLVIEQPETATPKRKVARKTKPNGSLRESPALFRTATTTLTSEA